MAWKSSNKSWRKLDDSPITMPPTLSLVPVTESASRGWLIPNRECPPGLQCLMNLDRLIIDQKVEHLEAATGLKTGNEYIVRDVRGRVVYYAAGNSERNDGICFGNLQPFNMRLMDAGMREAIRLSRPLNCSSCCFPCCLQELEVSTGGDKIGSVVQKWNPFYPSFLICDAAGNSVLSIIGPVCISTCPGSNVDFEILSTDGEHQVGKVSRQWSNLENELPTVAVVLGISFPDDLDAKIKAVLLAACLLIDFMFFEGQAKKNIL